MVVKDENQIKDLQNKIKEIVDDIDNHYVLEFMYEFIKSSWESWK